MADPTDPGPVSNDPELQAALTRILQIRGPLGVLKVLDTIVPVVSLGDVVQPSITVLQPSFRSTDIFSVGVVQAPAAGATLADTGPLAAGTYDVRFLCSAGDGTAGARIDLAHRNAADNANLALWQHNIRSANSDAMLWEYTFGYEIAANERLRATAAVAGAAGARWYATIFARLRT